MGFMQSFRLALRSLSSSKLRSFLTMLGIIIGVGSVIILVSLMQGMSNKMTSTFEELGTNRLTVTVTGRGSSRTVDVDDMYQLFDEHPECFSLMSPTVSMQAQVKQEAKSYDSTTVTGVSEDYQEIQGCQISSGRNLGYVDMEKRAKVCLIGSYVAKNAFSGKPVGQTIKLNGNLFTVVGVLKERGDSSEGSSDDTMLIPYTTASKLGMSRVSSYIFMTTDPSINTMATNIIKNALYAIFQSSDFYKVTDMADMISNMNALTSTMTLVVAGIAAISLVVGGIGIMNIMLVSVTERTREIGIRKSLGAKKRDIMRQFVIEAMTTSACGGVIGIFVGAFIAIIVGKVIGMTVTPSIDAVGIAFGVSVAIGIFFGYMPANKAAKLNPIDALRYD